MIAPDKQALAGRGASQLLADAAEPVLGQFTDDKYRSPKTYQWVGLPSTVQVQAVLHERETQNYVYCGFHKSSGLILLSKTIPAMCSFLRESLKFDLWASSVYRICCGKCVKGTTKGFLFKRFPEGPLPDEIQQLWELASSRIIIFQDPDRWLCAQTSAYIK